MRQDGGVPATPRAILMDYGGILVETLPGSGDNGGVVARLVDVAGGAVTPERAEGDLLAGRRAYGLWSSAMARMYAPVELSHERFWGDFVCADWPRQARMAVLANATELMRLSIDRGERWRIRDGVVDLVDLAHRHGIGLAVVSNTMCGAVFREFLDSQGLAARFAVHLYSDEVGVRKPNPEMAERAASALGVPLKDCWFVGDQLWRDVLCARRAGVGTVIQVHEPNHPPTEHDRPIEGWPTPDHEYDSMVDVHALLVTATETR
jgi:HAD superfamily hydrolase (TIGR01662 family)